MRFHRAFRTTGLLASCAFALGACSQEAPPPPSLPVPVTVTRAETRDMPVQFTNPGTVEAINAVAVTSQVDGQLLEARVLDGADVKQGDLMFRIDPRPAQAALQQAIATLGKDKATLVQARAQVERYAPVATKGFISADQMEQYRTNLGVTEATVKADEANVAAARITLTYTDIRAPISGRLGRIAIQPGNVVKANDANALVTINQIEPIYVNFALPSALLGRLQVAQRKAPLAVRANVIGVDAPVEGSVAFIDNAVDTSTGTIKLRARFDNDEHLLWPGQLVSVTLVLGHDANAVVVPDPVVQHGPDGSYVYVVKPDNTAEQRTISVARSVDGFAVVTDGLAAGESVVLDGQSRVEDKSPLKIEQAQGAP